MTRFPPAGTTTGDDTSGARRAAPAERPPEYLEERGARRLPPARWWTDHRRRVRARRRRRRERRRARRTWFGRHPWATGVLTVVVALSPVWWSLGETVTNPAVGPTVGSRFVEWVRDHGGSGIVRWVENEWYSHHPPPTGGAPPKGAIPGARHFVVHPGVGMVPHLPEPPAIVPFTEPAVAGEGQWQPAGRQVRGVPALYEAFLRPDAVHTSLVVAVAWMDTTLLRATLYSGSSVPGGGPWHTTAPVSPEAAATLVSAFNSGFRMGDANGGYYAEGRTISPLRDGVASFVIYGNGTATVGQWGRDVSMAAPPGTGGVVSVRQNLDLLVDGGRPVPGLNANDTSKWGFTLGNAVYVWRSGVGVTADGAIVYAAGPGLNITTLADVLTRAGAIRAMELDINPAWVNFASYAPVGLGALATPANGTPLLPAMSGGASRYFDAWNRDFITMSAR